MVCNGMAVRAEERETLGRGLLSSAADSDEVVHVNDLPEVWPVCTSEVHAACIAMVGHPSPREQDQPSVRRTSFRLAKLHEALASLFAQRLTVTEHRIYGLGPQRRR